VTAVTHGDDGAQLPHGAPSAWASRDAVSVRREYNDAMATALGIWLISALPVGLIVAGGLRRAGVAQQGESGGGSQPSTERVPALADA
jgi:uncharacterized protein YigE (DUF2233 family)